MKKDETIIDTKEIADLAKLSFSDEELSLFEKDMQSIVSFAATVSEAEAELGNPFHTLKNVVRDDSVMSEYSREELLSVAPEIADGFFKVPRTVE